MKRFINKKKSPNHSPPTQSQGSEKENYGEGSSSNGFRKAIRKKLSVSSSSSPLARKKQEELKSQGSYSIARSLSLSPSFQKDSSESNVTKSYSTETHMSEDFSRARTPEQIIVEELSRSSTPMTSEQIDEVLELFGKMLGDPSDYSSDEGDSDNEGISADNRAHPKPVRPDSRTTELLQGIGYFDQKGKQKDITRNDADVKDNNNSEFRRSFGK